MQSLNIREAVPGINGHNAQPHRSPWRTPRRADRAPRATIATNAEAAPQQQQQQTLQMRVCTSKTCRKQNSEQVLKFMQDLTQGTHVHAEGCGCLGNCGSGPNMVLQPAGRQLAHVSTLETATQVLHDLCGVPVPENVVRSLELKLLGNEAAIAGRLDEAIKTYSEAIELQPKTGLHLLLCNRASARLQQGQREEALEDAQQAMQLAPPSFINGWLRLIDCLYAVGQYQEAGRTLQQAVSQCRSFSKIPEFKTIVKALKKAGCDL